MTPFLLSVLHGSVEIVRLFLERSQLLFESGTNELLHSQVNGYNVFHYLLVNYQKLVQINAETNEVSETPESMKCVQILDLLISYLSFDDKGNAIPETNVINEFIKPLIFDRQFLSFIVNKDWPIIPKLKNIMTELLDEHKRYLEETRPRNENYEQMRRLLRRFGRDIDELTQQEFEMFRHLFMMLQQMNHQEEEEEEEYDDLSEDNPEDHDDHEKDSPPNKEDHKD